MLRLPELDHCFDRFNFILHYQSGNGHLYARSSEFNSVFNGQTVESGASPDWRFANDRNFVFSHDFSGDPCNAVCNRGSHFHD